MSTRNISLPKDLEDYVRAKVASGEYAHASEVVRDGLRLLMREESEKLEWLRNEVAKGIASGERGELIPSTKFLAEVKKRGRALLEARRRPR